MRCEAYIDRIGMRNVNSQNVAMEIIAYRNANDTDVRFDDWCGTVVTGIAYIAFCKGMVWDPNFKRHYGVGYVGLGPHDNPTMHAAYAIWQAMLRRCYLVSAPDYLQYGGRGVYVADEWHCLQNFISWYEEKCLYPDMQVDKDLNGSAHYGPDVCVMIPRKLNSVLQIGKTRRKSDLPAGVKLNRKRFVARSAHGGHYVYLGTYDTVDEAHMAYLLDKAAYVESVASELDQFLSDDARAAVANYCSRLCKEVDDILTKHGKS